MKILVSILLSTLFAAGQKPRLQSPIESMARELVANFAAGRFQAATGDFNDELRPVVTPEVLADVKGRLDQQMGGFYLIKEAHEGRLNAFRTVDLIARFEKGSVSVRVVFDIMDKVGAVYFEPVVPPPVDPALEATARDILANFNAGHFEEAVKPFNAQMRADLSPAAMANLSQSVAQIFGTFRSVTEVKQRFDKRLRVIDMILAYTNGPVAYHVAFDNQNRVAAMQIAPYRKD